MVVLPGCYCLGVGMGAVAGASTEVGEVLGVDAGARGCAGGVANAYVCACARVCACACAGAAASAGAGAMVKAKGGESWGLMVRARVFECVWAWV